jgi:hypothetical protein
MPNFLKICYCVLISSFFFISCTPGLTFNNTKLLNDYPSGSGLIYLNNKIYLIGYDATNLLVLDTTFHSIDSIQLFESGQKRIPKELKQDLESEAVITDNGSQKILLAGSGSLAPYRNYAWLIDPSSKQKVQLDVKPFYDRIKKEGVDALNIEGISAIPGGMVLASRGNTSFPANYLIFTSNGFWNNQDSVEIKKCKVGTNMDAAFFHGVSDVQYSSMSDGLLLTVSTENTTSAARDGAIGKSYLWIINNISTKKKYGGS